MLGCRLLQLRERLADAVWQTLVGAVGRNVPTLAAAEAHVLWALVQVVVGRDLALGADVRGGGALASRVSSHAVIPASVPTTAHSNTRPANTTADTPTGDGDGSIPIAAGAQRMAERASVLLTRTVGGMVLRVCAMEAGARQLVAAAIAVAALFGRAEACQRRD